MEFDRLVTKDSDLVRGALVVGVVVLLITVLYPKLHHGGELVNDRKGYELLWTNAKKRFQLGARGILAAAFEKHKNAFYMVTDNGIEMIVNPKYAHEIRNDERFSIAAYNEQSFHGTIPGFEIFKQNVVEERLFINAVRNKLTRSLGWMVVSASLADQAAEWHSIPLHATILPIIAQQSSRVFLGEELCHNANWLRITVNHTISFFTAVEAMQIQEARNIITPVLETRRAQRAELLNQGKDPKEFNDLIEWLEELSGGQSYDPARAQLKISVAAIHTTSDLLTQTLFNIVGNSKLIEDLREEIISTINTYGWQKSAIYNLKLMDSVLKETQRLKPISIGTMVRVALEDVQLSDGLEIPKGTKTLVSCHNMWDPDVYDNADEFNGYRFYKLRKLPGQENSAQLVSTSANHFGFGHGMHACPGRFFAAAEVKVTLCHILLKYDLRLVGDRPNVIEHGVAQYANTWGPLEIKRRKEEISV
ncbi:hypothetical protein EYZ11_007135 [Aspergillus tanneri]|uniref:Uncharacterized protein n=1 Tax=Aspergillus tanneri TaxID=1220188 RepID=A0A4S3JG27_9EURO|nr:hypothetical protein EYZ11_007135 [Aspergillus tanneri]